MSAVLSRILANSLLAMAVVGAPSIAQVQPTPPAAPAPAPSPEAALAAPVAPVLESIKVIVEGKAKNDGEIRFLFTPEGGQAKVVRVTVQKGMGKQDVCQDIAKELAVALGATYKVDRYDDDKVKLEGKDKAKFSLSITTQTVTGLGVKLN